MRSWRRIEIKSTIENVTPVGPINSFPVVHLKGVFVSANDINLDQGKRTEFNLFTTDTYFQYTYSVEVSVSADERNLYKALMLEYQFYDRQATLDPRNPAWATGRDAMRNAIISAFGNEAAFDVLDAGMWPKFTPVIRD